MKKDKVKNASALKKNSVKKNYLYNLAYQIFAIIVPFITTPYISRVLGSENIGIYSYTLSIETYFVMFGSLGMALYGAREIAYVQSDKKRRSQIFWELNLFRLITILISTIIYFLIAQFFGDYYIYFAILSIHLISTIFDISWFFQGIEDLKISSIRNIIIRTVGTALIFLLVKTQADLWIYIAIFSATQLLGNISLWFHLPKYIEKVPLRSLDLKRHLKPVLALFLPQIASQIYVVLDKVMIGAIISDKSELGFYEQGEKIVKMAITVITAVAAAMSPRIAVAFANKDKTSLDRYMTKTFKFTFMLALPMIAGLLLVSDRFVPIFFGPGYDRVSIIMKMLSPIILLIGLGSAIGVQYFIPTKRQNQLTISYIAGAVTNIVLNSLLIGRLGAVGAAIGTIFAEGVVTGIQIFFLRKDYTFAKILKCAPTYLAASLAMFAVGLAANSILPDDIFGLVVLITVCVLMYGISLIALRDQGVMEILAMLKHKRL